MKLHTKSLLTLLMLVLGIPAVAANYNVGTPALKTNATVDPFASNAYYLNDAPNDALLPKHELYSMNVGANSTGVEVRLNVSQTDFGSVVLTLDTDANSSTGANSFDHMDYFGNRPINVTGFEYYLASEWTISTPLNLVDATAASATDGNGANNIMTTPDVVTIRTVSGTTSILLTSFFTYNFLFGSGYGAHEALNIVAFTVSGDNAGAQDTIPSQEGLPGVNADGRSIINSAVFLNITTATGDLGATPTAASLDVDSSNLQGGNLTAGNDLQIMYKVGFSSVDSANTSAIPVTVIRERSGTNTTFNDFAYKLYGKGSLADYHLLKIAASTFLEGDLVWWTASVDGLTKTGSFGVSPLPPAWVNFVGDVSPAGGFVAPNEMTAVSAATNFKLVGDDASNLNDDPSSNLPISVTINYRANDTGAFTSAEMTWVKFENNNNFYKYDLPAYGAGTNVTFFIKAVIDVANQSNETLAMKSAGNYTLLVGIEPTRVSAFSISDYANDLSLKLPTGPADTWGVPGLIDITKFEVLSNDYNIEFRLTFTNLTNAFGSSAGFSVVIFSIYVNTGVTTGSSQTMWNERVTTSTPWNFALKADGFVPEVYQSSDLSAPMEGSGILNVGNTTTKTASIVVPVSTLGERPQDDWSYTVLAGSDDFNKFRAAGVDAGEWALGGGAQGETDPNVIDMVLPTGAGQTVQDFLLQNYDANTNTLAKVLAVGKGVSFVADTTKPTGTVKVEANGAEIQSGATITVNKVTLTIDVSDAEDAALSGLTTVEIYVGNVLFDTKEVSGLTATLTVDLTDLPEGASTITINIKDISGNVGTVTFDLTVDTSTTSGGGFLPFTFIPFVIGIAAIPIIRKKFKN